MAKAVRGASAQELSTPHSSGLTGLTTVACCNRLVTSRLPNTRRCIIKNKIRQWLPDPNYLPSGIHGVIHNFASQVHAQLRLLLSACHGDCQLMPKRLDTEVQHSYFEARERSVLILI